MNVLSLFDGISCARVALDRANINVNRYYSAEIEKNAIKVSEQNYPDIIRLGDVTQITTLPEYIDLLIGGSPCQDLSIGKKDRKGLEGNRSGLFWQYVRILNELKPRYFILENVASMPKKDRDIITREMGVEPIMFNASLVSAQSRKRLFWTNIKFELPNDKGVLLKDILHHECGNETLVVGRDIGRRLNEMGRRDDANKNVPVQRRVEVRSDDKCGTLTSVQKDNIVVNTETHAIRKLTPIECERLQGLPDNYTDCVATTNRYRCLGNAFNVDVIAHIFKAIQTSQSLASLST
jgi:site-specific DNA-cytosine methylase